MLTLSDAIIDEVSVNDKGRHCNWIRDSLVEIIFKGQANTNVFSGVNLVCQWKKFLQMFYLESYDMTTFSLERLLGSVYMKETHWFGNSSGDL